MKPCKEKKQHIFLAFNDLKFEALFNKYRQEQFQKKPWLFKNNKIKRNDGKRWKFF